MTRTADALDHLGDVVLEELLAVRPSHDRVGAAIAAAALVSRTAAEERSERDRIIRIARREGATLRALAEATGLSPQTIANISRDRA